jgi:hypothetical protein
MQKIMEINSDELAELIEDEKDIYVKLLDDDPDGLMIDWGSGDTYGCIWLEWRGGQDYRVDECISSLDLGTGDRVTVNQILDIVL